MTDEEREAINRVVGEELNRNPDAGHPRARRWLKVGITIGLWTMIAIRQATLIATVVIFYHYPPHWILWVGVASWLFELRTLIRQARVARDFGTLDLFRAPLPLTDALREKIGDVRTGQDLFARLESFDVESRKSVSHCAQDFLKRLDAREQQIFLTLMMQTYPSYSARRDAGYEV